MEENQQQTPASNEAGMKLSLQDVQNFINDNEDAKKWLNSEKDKFFSKSLENWKMKNLDSIIEAEVAKRNPAKSAAEIKLEELQRKFEAMEKANQRANLEKFAIKEANELQLPIELANFCIADSEEDTLSNLTTFKKAIDALVQEEVDLRLKGKGRLSQSQPVSGQPATTGSLLANKPVSARDLFTQFLNNQ